METLTYEEFCEKEFIVDCDCSKLQYKVYLKKATIKETIACRIFKFLYYNNIDWIETDAILDLAYDINRIDTKTATLKYKGTDYTVEVNDNDSEIDTINKLCELINKNGYQYTINEIDRKIIVKKPKIIEEILDFVEI